MFRPNDESRHAVMMTRVELETKLNALFARLSDEARRSAIEHALDILHAMLQSLPSKSQ